MISDSDLAAVAAQLIQVKGVVGVMLGGSRATGHHLPTSDVDLGLYYRAPLDLGALGAVARSVGGPDARVTAPGEWGPWVDGGGWLTIADTPVDWVYRDLDRVHASWADAQLGRSEMHFQVGHPFGFSGFAYAGEVALGVLLADPSGELRALQEQTRRYPEALGRALVDGLWEADFSLQNAGKAVERQNVAYVAGCVFRALLICAHALLGRGSTWVVNEKNAVRKAGSMPNAPSDFVARTGRVARIWPKFGSEWNAATRRKPSATTPAPAHSQPRGSRTDCQTSHASPISNSAATANGAIVRSAPCGHPRRRGVSRSGGSGGAGMR